MHRNEDLTGRPWPARMVATLLAVVLAVTAGLVGSASAPVAAVDELPAGLTWKVSENTWNSSSLSPARTTAAPATIAGDRFSFPEATDVSVNGLTGAVSATFPGSFTIGNLAQGNYRIRFADLELTIPAGRATGTLTADVAYGLAPPGQEPTLGTPVRVPIATLTFAPGAITDTGSNLSFTVTPDFPVRTDLAENPSEWRTFPQELIDLLQQSTPPLGGHFRQTADGQDAKAPAPLTVSLDYVADTPPAGLTWRVSQQAWTSSSLSPAHATEAPATKIDEGFSFPTPTSALYDPATGEGQIDLTGALVLGNVAQGNYRIKIADPSIVLAGGGTGTLLADVSYALWDGSEHVWSTAARVPVATFSVPDEALVVDGDRLSFVAHPDFVLRTDLAENPNGWRQFPQPFLDTLAPAVPSLLGHFRETGSGSDAAKAPAPIGLNVTFEAPNPDELLVRALYQGVLGRSASDGEVAYWAGRIDAGTTLETLVRSMARSTEGRRRLVTLGYQATLDRTPGAAERDYWVGRLAGGLTPESLRVQLLASPEAFGTWGGTPAGLAEGGYHVFLNRAGDPDGVAYWSDRLAGATTTSARGVVLKAFGRTAAATRAAIAAAFSHGCGTIPTLEPSESALFESVWWGSGHDPLTLVGAVIASQCPEGRPPT